MFLYCSPFFVRLVASVIWPVDLLHGDASISLEQLVRLKILSKAQLSTFIQAEQTGYWSSYYSLDLISIGLATSLIVLVVITLYLET